MLEGQCQGLPDYQPGAALSHAVLALSQLSSIASPSVCCHTGTKGSPAVKTPLFYYIYDGDGNCRARCGTEEWAAQRRYNRMSPSCSIETSGLPPASPVCSSLREERCQISKAKTHGRNIQAVFLACFFFALLLCVAVRRTSSPAPARGWSWLYINSQQDVACSLGSDRSALKLENTTGRGVPWAWCRNAPEPAALLSSPMQPAAKGWCG